MSGSRDIISELGKNTRFSKENQPANAGRKPSKLKKFFKKNNYGAYDKALCFENIILKYSAKELFSMIKTKEYPKTGKDLPAQVWGFIVAYIADVKRGCSAGGIFNLMMDRKHGKPQEYVKHSGSIMTDMTHEQREARIQELLDKRLKENKEKYDDNTKQNNQ